MSRSIQVYQRVLTQELEYTSIPGSPYTGVGVYRYTMESLHRSWSIPGSPYTEFGVYRYTRESIHRSWSILVLILKHLFTCTIISKEYFAKKLSIWRKIKFSNPGPIHKLLMQTFNI